MGDHHVLVIGQTPDPHIGAVIKALVAKGCQVTLLDRRTQDGCSLSLSEGLPTGVIATNGKKIAFDRFTSVWWRVKPSSPAEFSGGQGSVADNFRWSEWKALLQALPAFLPRAEWVNNTECHARISNKPAQLALAQSLGFRTPEFVISNDASEIDTLFDRHSRVLYKTLSSFIIPPDEIIYSNIVSREMIQDAACELSLAPGIFQEYVEKKNELRVTIVDEQLFVVKIDSQGRAANEIDWRRDQWQDMYEQGSLPQPVQEKLLAFHCRAGLRCAAYDLIETPNDEIVFLECNPGGQWLWLENRLGLPITAAIADALLAADRPLERQQNYSAGR